MCEAALDFALDGVAQGDDSAAVALPRLMRARVWRVEMPAWPMVKPLWKPACSSSHAAGSLILPCVCGPVGDFFGWRVQGGGDGGERGFGDDGVLEEGAGAAAVGIAFDDQHAFAVADLADGVVDLDGLGCVMPVCEVALRSA